MKISNVRLGFANNSSSSHSIIWWDREEAIPSGEYVKEFCYGWEAFTLTNEEDKAKYMAVMFYYELERYFGSDMGKSSYHQLESFADVNYFSGEKILQAYRRW